jgi:hypothetical protein
MAFEDFNTERRKPLREGRISLTTAYVNMGELKLPWKWSRIQYDKATNRVRFVPGDEEDGYPVVEGPNGSWQVRCASFTNRGLVPQGVYQRVPIVNPDEEDFTFSFVRPGAKFINRGGVDRRINEAKIKAINDKAKNDREV